ncbi:MAG TPA: glycosyltransferase family 39 protein [Gemmatimonadaceae bacterium]
MTSSPPPATPGGHVPNEWTVALAVLVGAALVRLAFAALIPLFPDETYYWDWSRHMAASYFDHPWGIAALIHGGDWLASRVGVAASPVTVRLLVIVVGFLASLFGAAIARQLGDNRAALITAVVFSAMPLASSGLVLATPDVPLLFTTTAALYCVVRALGYRARSASSLWWWIAAGIALGLAFSSKYTSILIPLGVTIGVCTRRGLRARLREPGPYIACVVATLVFAPVLVWNARHAWVSFAFQLHHGLGAPSGSPFKRELDLLGGQAGLATPILLVLLGIAVWRALRRPRSDLHYLLAVVAATCVAMFAFSAFRRPVEANWPALAYVPAVPLLALTDWSTSARRWLRWGVWLAVLVSVVAYVQSVVPILPLPARRDPVARSAGWGQLADSVDAARRVMTDRAARTWIGADKYQDASELAFRLPERPFTFSVNLSSRPNQYDLWPGFPQLARPGDDLVLVLDEVAEPHHTAVVLGPHFNTMQQGSLVPLRRHDGDVATYRRIWILRGWKGTWPAREPGY